MFTDDQNLGSLSAVRTEDQLLHDVIAVGQKRKRYYSNSFGRETKRSLDSSESSGKHLMRY